MPRVIVEVTQRIAATPQETYAAFADYRNLHPRILPDVFRDYELIAGGVGAGTRVRVTVVQWGSRRTFDMDVTEPEPGRRLVESDRLSDVVTEFIVEPVEEGRTAEVTIRTTWSVSGLKGWFEGWAAPRMLRPIYQTEINNLERLLRDRRERSDHTEPDSFRIDHGRHGSR